MTVDVTKPDALRAEAERRQQLRERGARTFVTVDAETARRAWDRVPAAVEAAMAIPFPPMPAAARVWSFTILGAPRTKKTSNRLQKFGGRLKVVPSAAWMRWRDEVQQQADGAHIPTPGLDVPLACRALFYRHADVGDAHGFYQGLADVLEEVGVVTNDRHIKHWDGSRLLVDRVAPRVEVTLQPTEEP